jgi:hypothetical protein
MKQEILTDIAQWMKLCSEGKAEASSERLWYNESKK